MCVAFLAGKCCYAQPVQYYCFAQVFQASYGLYYWWRWTLEPCWFFFCFPVSLRVAEAEVGVLRQDVHIVITTGPESAADLQDIIGRYSFDLNYLWVQCDPSNVSRLQVQFKVWWSFCWSFVLTKRTCSVPLSHRPSVSLFSLPSNFQSFVRSLVRSFVLSFIRSFVRSLVPWFLGSFAPLFILSFVLPFLPPSFSSLLSSLSLVLPSFRPTCPCLIFTYHLVLIFLEARHSLVMILRKIPSELNFVYFLSDEAVLDLLVVGDAGKLLACTRM